MTILLVHRTEHMTASIVRTQTTAVVENGSTFDTDILAGGKSENTIAQYRMHWLAYTAFAGSWAEAMQPATLARWRQHLLAAGYTDKKGNQRKYTVNAINLRLAAVRSVVAAAAEQGHVTRDTAEAFKAIRGLTLKANKERVREHNRTPIKRDQMDNICNAPNTSTGAGLMHQALLLTLRYTGARITDVVTMRIDDIAEYTNTAGVKGHVAKFMGKNETEPVAVELGEKAKVAIDRWLMWRKAAGVQSEYIFTSFTGRGDRQPSDRHINRISAWEMVQRYATMVNLSHVKPHDFRRYVGTELAKKDIRKAQKQLRHKRLETTAKHYVLDDVQMGEMDNL